MGTCSRNTFNKVFAVAILTAINFLNYMDRFTIAGILTSLEDKTSNGFKINGKPEGIQDWQGGLLQTAFIGSYMLLAPLFGYLGDRYARKYIMSVGIFLWSAFTLAGSFSVNYWMLFGTRLFVGVGEASYATIAPTILADLFPAESRLRILSIFYLAMPLGSAFGYIIGAELTQLIHQFTSDPVPWRWALRVTPGLGVIAVLLVLFVLVEPKRGHSDGQRTGKGVKGETGIAAYFKDVWYCLTTPTFLLTTIGFTSVTFTTGALAQWAPLYIYRVSYVVLGAEHRYGKSTAALIFGGITVVAGIAGTLCGSELSKKLGKKTRKAEAIVCALGMMLGTPFLFLALVVAQYKNLYLGWVFVFIAEFFLCLNWAPVAAILLYTIVPGRRSTAEAVQILMSHLLGDAVSPVICGAISDSYLGVIRPVQGQEYGQAISLEFGLLITAFVCVLGGGAFLASTLTVEADRKAVEIYNSKANHSVQKSGHVDYIPPDAADDFDEHKELLADAMKEKDIVSVGYKSI